MNDLEIIYTALQNATVVDEKPQKLEENKDRIHLGNFDPYIKEEDLETVKLTMLGTNESVFEDGDIFIDLGLPSGTIWMVKNIGAETDKDLGLFFQYGALEGYEYDSDGLRSHCSADTAPYLYDAFDENYKLLPEYDCVYQATNGKACLPTVDQWTELWEYASKEWYSEDNPYHGWTTIIGPNGKELKLVTDTYIWSNGESWGSDGENMGYWTGNATAYGPVLYCGQYNNMYPETYNWYLAVPVKGVKVGTGNFQEDGETQSR